MNDKIDLYHRVFQDAEGVEIAHPFHVNNGSVDGKINLTVEDKTLPFDVDIPLGYPLGRTQSSIKFICREISHYNHQNLDGSICIHPDPNEDAALKLQSEISLLKKWMKDYYIDGKKDSQYEYLLFDKEPIWMLFDGNIPPMTKHSFGYFDYAPLNKDPVFGSESFVAVNIGDREGQWSELYKNFKKGIGIWVYIENEPILQQRQVVSRWLQLEQYFSKEAIDFLYKFHQRFIKAAKKQENYFLMLGYKIPHGEAFEIHWELIKVPKKPIPIQGIKTDTGWEGQFIDQKITWGQTSNCEYYRFFGRGKLSDKLTEGKILIIGIGAIGSSLATSLVRGGIKNLTIADFDFIESGNVCRSEYNIRQTGQPKLLALFDKLLTTSPFIDIHIWENMEKVLPGTPKYEETNTKLSDFDYVFDCTTDMEVAFMLDKMELEATILNISITDKAKELVCVTGKNNVATQKHHIFTKLNPENVPPTYYPGTGCQYPTFRASYVDINALLNYAVKNINNRLNKNVDLNTFVISVNEDGNSIKLELDEY